MGLWYPKDSGFELTAFSDADHAGCLDTRKITSGEIQFLGHSGKTNVFTAEKISVLSCYFLVRYSNHIGEEREKIGY
ncbi:hypothetical protein Tco_0080690 [Tanacetum coccineum]